MAKCGIVRVSQDKFEQVEMKKVMLTVPDEIYVLLEGASEESMRPIATEALYRMKLGLSKELAVSFGDKIVGVGVEGFITDKKGIKPKREKLDKLVKDGVVKKGVKELPSQEVEGFKTYFKEKKI